MMRYSTGHIIAVALRILAIVLLLAAVPQVTQRYFASAKNLDAAETTAPAGNTTNGDISSHPLYAAYKFEKSPNVVNIGVQPLYMPTNIIVEAMKRDAVLGREMEKIGVKLKFYDFLKGADVNFFLQRGDLHGGFAGDMPTLVAASKMKIKIPALAEMGFTSIVSKKLYSIKELRGRRIGYAFGSNAHYGLLNALTAAGIAPNDVSLVAMEISDMPDALAAGRIDAFSAWEPTVKETLKSQPKTRVIHRSISSGYLYFTQDFCTQRTDALRAVLAAEIRAVRWLQRDRENLLRAAGWAADAASVVSRQKNALTRKQTAWLAANDLLGMDSEPRIPMRELSEGGQLHTEFQFLKSIRLVEQSTQWSAVLESFDTAVMDEILANPSKYRVRDYDYH
jgi:NitT/TauT family transport system substrate-binding protein